MPAGRPTKYEEEYCDLLIEFFDQEPWEDLDIKHYKNGEVSWTDKKRMPRKLPTMVGFWRWLNNEKGKDVGIRTLYDWIDKDHESYQKEFSQTFTRVAKKIQKDFLIQNGLQGTNNPVFAKFVAINLSDMTDKVSNEHSGKDGGPIHFVETVIDPKEE